jgi:hypothetical protein
MSRCPLHERRPSVDSPARAELAHLDFPRRTYCPALEDVGQRNRAERGA